MISRAIELEGESNVFGATPLAVLPDAVSSILATVRAVYCNSVRMHCRKNLANYGSKPVDGDKVTATGRNSGHTGWSALASHLINLRAPVDLYIRAQFEAFPRSGMAMGKPFPGVKLLYSDWATKIWNEYSADRPQAVLWQMQSDMSQLSINVLPMIVNLGWSEREAIEYALGDQFGCVITPLTRYCTAVVHNIPRIADDAFRGALFQYVFEFMYYDNVLGSGIPEPLREAARNVRRKLWL